MKNPNPVNLQTSAEIRKAGWQAECRDADGHLCRTHVPFETDEEIVWLVREAMEHSETVTIWPDAKVTDSPPPSPHVVVPDEAILDAQGYAMSWQPSEDGPSYREAKEIALGKIKAALAAATDAPQLQHVLSVTQHPNVESSNGEQSSIEAAIQHVTVADYATRLFDLHGFMLLETYRDKPAVTVTFPDLAQAQQFHSALVELSTHRQRPSSLMEGLTDV